MAYELLFAPWRKGYLEGPKLKGCFICEAISKKPSLESLLIMKTDTVGVMLNRYPYTNGHLLIVPHHHVSCLNDLNPEELTQLILMVRELERILSQVYSPDGFNIGINLGSAAGAGLKDHLHFHLMPRWSGDTNFMATCGNVRVLPETLSETYQRLYSIFNTLTLNFADDLKE